MAKEGIRVDPKKVEAVENWPRPTVAPSTRLTKKEVSTGGVERVCLKQQLSKPPFDPNCLRRRQLA